jgi:hypothetical protein
LRRKPQLADQDVDAERNRVQLVPRQGDGKLLLRVAGGHLLENRQELLDAVSRERHLGGPVAQGR